MTSRKFRLLEHLERQNYITSQLVRDAMENVPREAFIPDELKDEAYADRPLPIGFGQTISAPHMCAMMLSGLELDKASKINLLEVGTGSGYHASLAAFIIQKLDSTGHVYTIERIPELANRARDVIKKLGFNNVITVIDGDGTLGYSDNAPYNRIMVTAAAPSVPRALISQLDDDGLMLIPVGDRHYYQKLLQVSKHGKEIIETDICGVSFVPLIGKDGFKK
ncbi:MAG: protein-L-isoaspartate O-methyltransferase [Promethearchaeota archaeon]